MTGTVQLGRFTMRDVQTRDVVDLFSMFSDPDTTRYLGFRTLQTMDDAHALLRQYITSPTRWLSVFDGSDFLGVIGLEVRGHQATVVIAFNKSRKARGAGRALSTPLVEWIFTQPQIWRVWAICHVENAAVVRVLERMGAQCEGVLRRAEFFPNVSDEPQNAYVYAITRDTVGALA